MEEYNCMSRSELLGVINERTAANQWSLAVMLNEDKKGLSAA